MSLYRTFLDVHRVATRRAIPPSIRRGRICDSIKWPRSKWKVYFHLICYSKYSWSCDRQWASDSCQAGCVRTDEHLSAGRDHLIEWNFAFIQKGRFILWNSMRFLVNHLNFPGKDSSVRSEASERSRLVFSLKEFKRFECFEGFKFSLGIQSGISNFSLMWTVKIDVRKSCEFLKRQDLSDRSHKNADEGLKFRVLIKIVVEQALTSVRITFKTTDFEIQRRSDPKEKIHQNVSESSKDSQDSWGVQIPDSLHLNWKPFEDTVKELLWDSRDSELIESWKWELNRRFEEPSNGKRNRENAINSVQAASPSNKNIWLERIFSSSDECAP